MEPQGVGGALNLAAEVIAIKAFSSAVPRRYLRSIVGRWWRGMLDDLAVRRDDGAEVLRQRLPVDQVYADGQLRLCEGFAQGGDPLERQASRTEQRQVEIGVGFGASLQGGGQCFGDVSTSGFTLST